MRKNYTGFTESTKKNLQLNAGLFFKNFAPDTDTTAAAIADGRLLGATQGGGEFSAVPTFRNVEIDGMPGRVKGLADIEKWECYIKATIIEVSETAIAAALACTETDSTTKTKYKVIKGRNYVADKDYIDNVTWVGTLAGYDDPICIQVFNALNEDGFKLTVADKSEGKISCTFYGYNDVDDVQDGVVAPPFAVWYPKGEE